MTEAKYIAAKWVLAEHRERGTVRPRGFGSAAKTCYNSLTGKNATCLQPHEVAMYVLRITEIVNNYEQKG